MPYCWRWRRQPPPETRKGDKWIDEGRKAEARNEYEKALELYEKALSEDPADPGYQLSVRRVRFQASQRRVDQGQNLREAGKLEEALKEFKAAYALDPSSIIAEQEMRRTAEMIERAKSRAARAKRRKTKGSRPSKPRRRMPRNASLASCRCPS